MGAYGNELGFRGRRRTRRVLCALSDQHQQEYGHELAELRRQGIDLFVQASPDLAMELIEEVRPTVVLVGTDVGPMEWFEFVTRMARQCRDLNPQVIVVPAKSDPFSPVLQTRDPATGGLTGHYLTDRLHLDDIVSTVCSVLDAGSATGHPELAQGSSPFLLAELNAADRKRGSD
jgi:hypothetical protein